jgi:hypothetical protein
MQGRTEEIEEKGTYMSGSILNIPSELRDPFFFPDEKVRIDGSQIVPCDPFFAFEILFYTGESFKPVNAVERMTFIRENSSLYHSR